MQDGTVYKMTICKMIQFARVEAINENTRNGKRNDLKELLRPYKLSQGVPTKGVKGGENIGETCLPTVGPPCNSKVLKKEPP